jgi:hypothetical protein
MKGLVLFSLVLAGCASTQPPPLRVHARDLATLPPLTDGQPVIVEVEAGDVIPLDVSVDGELLASPKDTKAVPLIAKRRFFLRVAADGIQTSLDGVSFDGKSKQPGRLTVGVSVTRAGVRGRVDIVTPRKLD